MKNDVMRRRAGGVKLSSIIFCVTVLMAWLPARGRAQVNSGSNGSDSAFNPATNVVINMADHPNGIYQYTSVNISNGVTVTFIPNANNAPVTWLVQGDCVIAGILSVSGADTTRTVPGAQGGPGGWGGGDAALSPTLLPGAGLGPGGGTVGTDTNYIMAGTHRLRHWGAGTQTHLRAIVTRSRSFRLVRCTGMYSHCRLSAGPEARVGETWEGVVAVAPS
jgi:hypothetical protein